MKVLQSCYCHVDVGATCAVLAIFKRKLESKIVEPFKHTMGDQKFRDYAHENQYKTTPSNSKI